MQRLFPIDLIAASALAARRRAAGLTQNDLALALTVSEGTISKIETARVPCPPPLRAVIEAAIDRLAGAKMSAAR